MAGFIRSNNFLVNSLMLPGMYVPSTYTYDDFPHIDLEQGFSDAKRGIRTSFSNANVGYNPRVRGSSSFLTAGKDVVFPLRLVYIPVCSTNVSYADVLNSPGSHVPGVLQIARNNVASSFIIHLHGNACDAAQVGQPGKLESAALGANYLIVEYPGYGLAAGSSSEMMLNRFVSACLMLLCLISVMSYVVMSF